MIDQYQPEDAEYRKYLIDTLLFEFLCNSSALFKENQEENLYKPVSISNTIVSSQNVDEATDKNLSPVGDGLHNV